MSEEREYLVDGTPVDEWEDCAIEGCPNKRCAALRSIWCWPHTRDINGSISSYSDEIAECVE